MQADEENAAESRASVDGWSAEELDEFVPAQPSPDDRIAGLSATQMRAAAAICVVLFAGIAGTGLALSKYDRSTEPIALSDCAQLSDGTKRLACFDRLATAVTLPFKGGSPFRTISDPEL